MKSVKPKLLYIAQDVYKAFQEASKADWKKQVKAKTVKSFAPATDLFNKLVEADIVIYGTVLQKCKSGEGIIPEDIFSTWDNANFWTRLLEISEIETIKTKCTSIEFTFTIPKSKIKRKFKTKRKTNVNRKKSGNTRKGYKSN